VLELSKERNEKINIIFIAICYLLSAIWRGAFRVQQTKLDDVPGFCVRGCWCGCALPNVRQRVG
jgi:hypothetical protein